MSITRIIHHNESVFDLEHENVIEEVQETVKLKSKFEDGIKRYFSSLKEPRKTMGYAKIPLRPPSNFLKKNEGIKLMKKSSHKCIHGERIDLPKKQDIIHSHEKKNYKIENIKEVINSKPRRPKPRYIDREKGDVHDLCSSGIMPKYVFHPNFGRVPKYLERRKEVCKKLQEIEDYNHPHADDNSNDVALISEDERIKILSGLKENWNKLFKVYNSLPVSTDTTTKEIRKRALENRLSKLEKHIMFIEENAQIYVCHDRK